MLTRILHFLGHLPVKVLRGLARGAWFSLYPHSAYWRLGGNDPAVEAALLHHACRPGLVCWDLGAHYGIYAIGLARRVGPAGRIEAFEPDPVSFRRLSWHARLNRLPQLKTHPVAASNAQSTSRLYQYESFGSTTSHLPFPGETLAGVPFREITTVALDAWVATGRIRSPHFIKIDVEGHAVPALQGMRHTLSIARPTILLGVHTHEELNGCRALLSELGYTLQPCSPASLAELETNPFGELLCLPPAAV
ncbi:MAG: FkbM family methyltransferase [Verrucomicrobia bacterium]|nr:FkbM family methyltransferase [Verrucomicrobiota bacterium]